MKRSLAVLAAGLLMCLSGCGQSADPPAQADPTPSVSQTTTAPKKLMPEETVRAWVRAYNRLARTGDSYAVAQLSDVGCQTCTDLTSPVAAVIAAGGAYRGGDWLAPRTRVTSAHGDKAVVDAYVVMTAGATRHRSGEPFHAYPLERHILEFTLSKPAGTWLVKQIVWL